jgi:hypothetical protein
MPRRHSSPDSYHFTLNVKAKEGRFWFSRIFQSPPRELKIWPDLGWTAGKLKNAGGFIGKFTGTIFPGKPYPDGVRGEIEVVAPVDVDIDVPSARNPDKVGIVPGRRVGMTFTTGALEKFRQYQYNVVITTTQKLTQGQWAAMEKQLQANFAQ